MVHFRNYLFSLLISLGLFWVGTIPALAAPGAPAATFSRGDLTSPLADSVQAWEPVGYVLVSQLNLRAGPGLHYPRLARLGYGEAVFLTGRNAATTWLQVQVANGQQGWVFADYIDANSIMLTDLPIIELPDEPVGYVRSEWLNVRTGPSTMYPTISRLWRGEQVTLLGRNNAGTWLSIGLSDYEQSWVSANYINSMVPIFDLPITEPLDEPVGYVRSEWLNVRTGPSTMYPIISRLWRGEQVTLLGRNNAGTWLSIGLSGYEQSWVSANYINSMIPIFNLPIKDTFPVCYVGAYFLNVRTGPGLDYPIIYKLDRGQQVYVHGSNMAGSWLRISRLDGGARGWVSARYLMCQVPLSQLPVVR